LELVKTLEKDDFVVQTAYYMSPPKWHLGHVSWLYEVVLSKLNTDYEFYSEEFSEYLNSYYRQFGEPRDKGKRGIMSRPTVEQVLEYFQTVNKLVTDFLKKNPISNKANQLLTMGMHHECQHQELLVYDLQNLLADEYRPVKKNSPPTLSKVDHESVAIGGGLYTMGYNGGGFCYDIELPEHKVFLEDYRIDAFPVTNGQYLSFIEDGGYNDFKCWLSDGWDTVKKNNWHAPMYWEKENERWVVRDFLGKRKINPNEPVCHVSFYEADAYCRWAGKRLPTEAEWEKAACWNEEKMRKTIFPWGNEVPNGKNANLLESYLWNTSELGSYPESRSSYGCYQMIGDVWEWTSSEYSGYPGFKTGFSEYNDKWFTNQKVLRGGSFGTPRMSIRGSYRNFFRLDERWLFSGFRCAQDA
jgi:ergothioneine biosynthesis protein EgtB